MRIEKAANLLYERFREVPWLTAVGVGEKNGNPCIFLYIKSLNAAPGTLLREGWYGFPVVARKMARPRPVMGNRVSGR